MFLDILFWLSLACIVLLIVRRVFIPVLKKPAITKKPDAEPKQTGFNSLLARGLLLPSVVGTLVIVTFLLRLYPGMIPEVNMPNIGFDLFSSWSAEEQVEIEHLSDSFDMYQLANDVKTGQPHDAEGWESINALLQAALDEAKQVSDDILERVHPELPEHFNNDFKPGLSAGIFALRIKPLELSKKEQFPDSLKTQYEDSLNASRELLTNWATWYNSNSAEIQEAVSLD